MRLTTVKIRNFRCIKDLAVDLDETTVLIGENNSGKTAFLEAVRICLERLRGRGRGPLDEYDYHLPDDASTPVDAAPIERHCGLLDGGAESTAEHLQQAGGRRGSCGPDDGRRSPGPGCAVKHPDKGLGARRSVTMLDLDSLNVNQRQAVDWNNGPMLVLAGPGAGKTRVLTTRVARLIQETPDKRFRVLALTFTNKAAEEMRGRVAQLLGPRIRRARLTTFHGFAADVLRQHGSHFGLRPDFTILNQDADRHLVLHDAIQDANHPGIPAGATEKGLLPMVDRLLRDGQDGRESQDAPLPFAAPGKEWIRPIYRAYIRRLIEGNHLDFGALLVCCLRLFSERPRIARLHSSLRLASRPGDTDQLALLCEAFYELTLARVQPPDAESESVLRGDPLLTGFLTVASSCARASAQPLLDTLGNDLLDRGKYRDFITKTLDWRDRTPRMADADSDEETDERNIWRSLTTEIRHHLGADPPLSQFLQQLDLRQKTSPPSKSDVQCLTIHLAKGKEFHHVYLIGLAEEQLPSFHAVRSGPAAMEEERRNCFVAITRVQSTLTLTHADSYFGWSKQPSRFLQDMGLRSGDTAC